MKMLNMILVASAAILFCSSGMAQKVETPFFGNKKCPISGKPVKKNLAVKYNGEKIFVCCKACVKKVKAAPKDFYAKAYPASKNIDIKNPKCPIMKGKSKKNVTTTFQGHVVHFCCGGCDKKFRKEPNKHLARLTSKKKLTDLGNTHCIVMADEKIQADNFIVYNNQIINICCDGCAGDFAKNPKKYLAAYKKSKETKKGKEKGHDHGGHDH